MVISIKNDAKMQEIRIKTAIHLRINPVSEDGDRRFIRQVMILPPSRDENGNKLNKASERLKIAKFSQSGRKNFEKIKKNMFAQGPARSIIISYISAIYRDLSGIILIPVPLKFTAFILPLNR